METLRPEGLSYIQNTEKQWSVVLIWAQATLVSVAMMRIPSAQNSPRFCCIVRLMTLSSIRHPLANFDFGHRLKPVLLRRRSVPCGTLRRKVVTL
jgi:hypothetical protein